MPKIYNSPKEMMMKKIYIILPVSFALLLTLCEMPSETENGDDLTPPDIPTGLEVVGSLSGDGVIVLNWNPNAENDFEGYRLYRAEDSDDVSMLSLIVDTTGVGYIDLNLDYNTTYYYRLTAYDENGNESEKSNADKKCHGIQTY